MPHPLAPLPPGYTPRAGESSVPHRAVRENLESFLADTRAVREHGFGESRFVEEEFRSFLRCGVVAHGFVGVRCASCGHCAFRPIVITKIGIVITEIGVVITEIGVVIRRIARA